MRDENSKTAPAAYFRPSQETLVFKTIPPVKIFIHCELYRKKRARILALNIYCRR